MTTTTLDKPVTGTVPWVMKGELILNCNCTVFCPCVVSLGKHPPTEGYCQAWVGIRIDEGHYGGENLGGLNVGMIMDIPGNMGRGNWKAAAYIDDRATEAAYDGLIKILSGAARGTTGLFGVMVSAWSKNHGRPLNGMSRLTFSNTSSMRVIDSL